MIGKYGNLYFRFEELFPTVPKLWCPMLQQRLSQKTSRCVVRASKHVLQSGQIHGVFYQLFVSTECYTQTIPRFQDKCRNAMYLWLSLKCWVFLQLCRPRWCDILKEQKYILKEQKNTQIQLKCGSRLCCGMWFSCFWITSTITHPCIFSSLQISVPKIRESPRWVPDIGQCRSEKRRSRWWNVRWLAHLKASPARRYLRWSCFTPHLKGFYKHQKNHIFIFKFLKKPNMLYTSWCLTCIRSQ